MLFVIMKRMCVEIKVFPSIFLSNHLKRIQKKAHHSPAGKLQNIKKKERNTKYGERQGRKNEIVKRGREKLHEREREGQILGSTIAARS